MLLLHLFSNALFCIYLISAGTQQYRLLKSRRTESDLTTCDSYISDSGEIGELMKQATRTPTSQHLTEAYTINWVLLVYLRQYENSSATK